MPPVTSTVPVPHGDPPVAPGGVNTPIYSQAGSYIGLKGRPPIPIYSPERVARSVVRTMASSDSDAVIKRLCS